jgi:hypothetical protein
MSATYQDYLTVELPFPGITYTVVIVQHVEHDCPIERYEGSLFEGQDEVFTVPHESKSVRYPSDPLRDPMVVFGALSMEAHDRWLTRQERDE